MESIAKAQNTEADNVREIKHGYRENSETKIFQVTESI